MQDRYRRLLLFVSCLLIFVNGCGSGTNGSSGSSGSSGAPAAVGPRGSVSLTIQWPPPPRVVPANTGYVVVDVTGPNKVSDRQIAYRPTDGSTTTTLTFGPYPIGNVVFTSAYYAYADSTPLAVGSKVIAVTANQTIADAVTVKSTIAKVAVNAMNSKIVLFGKGTAVATAMDAAGNTVLTTPGKWTWSSSNPAVATVAAAGNPAIVTGISTGSATLTATDTESGVSGTLTVAVTNVGLAAIGWPKFNFDAMSSGRTAASGATGAIRWQVTLPGLPYHSPIVGPDGNVYVQVQGSFSSADDKFVCVDGATGAIKWQLGRDFSGAVSALSADGLLYTGTGGWSSNPSVPTYQAINATDQSVRWSVHLFGGVESPPTIGPDGTVYVATDLGAVYSISHDGSINWSLQLIDSGPNKDGLVGGSGFALSSDGTLYLETRSLLYAIDSASGALKWKYTTGATSESSAWGSTPSVTADGTVYFGSYDGYFYALYGSTGTLKWRTKIGVALNSSPAIGQDGSVYIGGGATNRAYALDGSTGAVKWSTDVGASSYDALAIDGSGTVYVTTSAGLLYALSPTDGSIKWQVTCANTPFSLATAPAIGPDGTIYVGTWDQTLTAIK